MGSPSLRLARLALYLAWTVGLMPVQVIGLALRRQWTSKLPVFYHRWCCRILGFRIRVIGTPTAERPVLFAANHISYTDITILGSVITGSFIAKAEVADWPFFGWLVAPTGLELPKLLLRLTLAPPSPVPGVSKASTPAPESGDPAVMLADPEAEIMRVAPPLPVDATAGWLPTLPSTTATPKTKRITRGPASAMHPPCTTIQRLRPGSHPRAGKG